MSKHCNYDTIASSYNWISELVFGKQLFLAKTHFIKRLPNLKRILVFGGGTGKLLAPLCQAFPTAHIHFLEDSKEMVSNAQKTFPEQAKRIHFEQGDESKLGANQYDAVFTPFVLDVFENTRLTHTMGAINESLLPGGHWIHTDFYIDGSSQYWQRVLVKIMYLFFAIVARQTNQKLPDFDQLFKRLPLTRLGQAAYCRMMVRTIWYQKNQEMEPSH